MSYGSVIMKKENAMEGIIPKEQIIPFGVRLKSTIGDESVRGFAKRCSISSSTVLSYLSGNSFPTLDRLAVIAEVGNVDMGWLVTGDKKINIETNAKDSDFERLGLMSGEEKQLIEIITPNEVPNLVERLRRNGVDSVILPERVNKIALLINDLSDEDRKEILLLINEAQYCSLVGLEFKPTSNKQKDRKISNG
jgi:transcriptional regulator with XRE-family HTH domain